MKIEQDFDENLKLVRGLTQRCIVKMRGVRLKAVV